MKKEVFINMENQNFDGNILDMGFENYGVAYNIFKKYNEEASVEYLCGKEEEQHLQENMYDSCVLLFSFHNIGLKYNKTKIIKDIQRYLKEEGILYIWDIDKGYMKSFNRKIKIMLPDRKIKHIQIRNLNVFQDHSKETVVKIVEPYFEILNLTCSDQIYFIKAKKKGNS